MSEEWKTVPGFEEYQVSDHGRVRTTKGCPAGEYRYLNLSKNNKGYVSVHLRSGDRELATVVHRLVLTAFRGDCPPGKQGCHNNGDRTDNRLDNLRWDTPSNNCRDKHLHGTAQVGSKNPAARLDEEQVAQIKRRLLDGEENKTIAADFNTSSSRIASIRNDRYWRHVEPAPEKTNPAGPPRQPPASS